MSKPERAITNTTASKETTVTAKSTEQPTNQPTAKSTKQNQSPKPTSHPTSQSQPSLSTTHIITPRIPEISYRAAKDLLPFPCLQDVFDPLQPHRYQELLNSIADRGLEAPPVVWKDHILSGSNRVKACIELGWEHIPVLDRSDLGQVEAEILYIEANTARRELSIAEKMRAAGHLKNLIGKAKDRIAYGMRPTWAFGPKPDPEIAHEDEHQIDPELNSDLEPTDDDQDDSIMVVIGSGSSPDIDHGSSSEVDPEIGDAASDKPPTDSWAQPPTNQPVKPLPPARKQPPHRPPHRPQHHTDPLAQTGGQATKQTGQLATPITPPNTIANIDEAAQKLGISRRQFDELVKANEAPDVVRQSVGEGPVSVTVKEAATVTRALTNPDLKASVETQTRAFQQAKDEGNIEAQAHAKKALLNAAKGHASPAEHTIESGRLVASMDPAKGRIQVAYRDQNRALPVLLISTKGLSQFGPESYQEAFELALALLAKSTL